MAKSPNELDKYLWMCVQHAREHNKNWNFFANMSDDEQKAFQEQNRYGGRPTWKMAQNARASAAARAGLDGKAEIDNAVGIFNQTPGAAGSMNKEAAMRSGRRLTKLQVDSFKSMNLKTDAASSEIRKKYAELVKRFHPDSNEGDRGAEEQLQAVIKAHQILKKAGFC
ncbi:MAG: DnaJ domain-containing protein [Parvularculaceae bacterium]